MTLPLARLRSFVSPVRLAPVLLSTLLVATAAWALSPGVAAAAGPTPLPAAHELGQSYMFLRIYEDSIVVRLEITTEDIERALDFGWNVEGGVTSDQVAQRLDQILEYVGERARVRTASGPLTLGFRRFETHFLEVAEYVVLFYQVEGLTEIPDALELTYIPIFDVDSDHRNFLVVEHNWKTATFNSEVVAGIFSPSAPTQRLDLTRSSRLKGFLGLVRLGVWHIWIGYDHILFLMALVLPSVLVRRNREWEPAPNFTKALIKIVTIVTFFTLAHTVTLSLAALDVIRLESRLVESIIAGSIAVAAWANLAPGLNVREAMIAFVFGLFHGFGFASVLGDIGLGREFLVLSLLGFNIGVEIGQVAIIALVFPVLYVLRDRWIYRPLLRYGSMLLIAVALLWFFERVFEFNVPLGPILRRMVGMG